MFVCVLPVVWERGESLCHVLGDGNVLWCILFDVSLREDLVELVCLGQCRSELWSLDCMLSGRLECECVRCVMSMQNMGAFRGYAYVYVFESVVFVFLKVRGWVLSCLGL